MDTQKKRAASLTFGSSHRSVVQPPDNATSAFDRSSSLGLFLTAQSEASYRRNHTMIGNF